MARTAKALALLALCAALPVSVPATEIYSDGEIVVSLTPGHTIEEVNATWGTQTVDEFPEGNLYLVFAEGVGDLEQYAAMMQADPAVAEAEANYFEDTPEGIRQMVIVAVGGEYVDYEDQEIGQRIGLDQAHLKSLGYGVTVGVLDTGVDPDHVVFQGRLAPDGYDFVSDDAEPWEEANGIDDDGDGMTDDGFGHGSMVAGIIALVAPQAKILPVRVLDDEGRGDAWNITKAVRYAINHGANVLNLSFGVPRTISTIGHQISFADSLGVPVVAGAGNDSTESPVYFPGAHSKAMLITALDSLDVKASFADWNSKVLVSAPGTGVRSAYPGGQWGLGAGCSFATPFVTGEVALVLALEPGMSNDQVKNRVEAAVDPIDQIPGNQPYEGKLGSGRVFLPLALDGLVSSVPGSPAFPGPALAFPNPARESVLLRVPTGAGRIDAVIFDARGRRIRKLAATRDEVLWDGRDESGRKVASGIYHALVTADGREYGASVSLIR